MTDETTGGLRFRVSACRRFIVAQIGAARPHVLSIEEAEGVAQAYRANEASARSGALFAVAAYEGGTAGALEIAIREARGR